MSARYPTSIQGDLNIQAINTPVSLEIIIYDKMYTNCNNSTERIKTASGATSTQARQQNSSKAAATMISEKYISQSSAMAKTTNANRIRRCKTRITVPRRAKGMFSSTIISLAFISYAISNQMATLILSTNELNSLTGGGGGNNLIDHNAVHSHKLASFERSLVSLVSASPSPDPSPASTRTATSSSHRMPPMNGSIFGKRSLGSNTRSTSAKSTEKQLSTGLPVDQTVSYSDIITEVIENFMSNNNNGDPSEATVAFCRVIVYECKQLLSHRKTLSANNKVKIT